MGKHIFGILIYYYMDTYPRLTSPYIENLQYGREDTSNHLPAL
jgi:hypothetical protein